MLLKEKLRIEKLEQDLQKTTDELHETQRILAQLAQDFSEFKAETKLRLNRVGKMTIPALKPLL